MAKSKYELKKKKKRNKRFIFFRKKNHQVKELLRAQT